MLYNPKELKQLKGKNNFGYKFVLFVLLAVAVAHFAAMGFRDPFFEPDPNPAPPDTSKNKNDSLKFPIYDRTGNPAVDNTRPSSIDLDDPANFDREVEYDPEEKRYYFDNKVGDDFIRNPTYMTMDEYLKYEAEQAEKAYWKRRLDALTLFNKKPNLPTMYKEGLFDRIFGGNTISVRPQGNVDVTLGGNWQNIQNPTLVQSAQKYGIFDFDMQMNINLLATVGDKLKLNISNNTRATFDYQNVQKLEYVGKEDEIIKKIEAGNVSFPLQSSLISGVQSLFGLKTQLQFGKLWVTAVVSQQRSKRQSLTIQGGSQTQQFSIKADDYEENRHFLLGQYFRNNYNYALKDFPVIRSLVNITKIEVWVTNSIGATEGVRDVVALMDLGESDPYQEKFKTATAQQLPDNRANSMYDLIMNAPRNRAVDNVTNVVQSIAGVSTNAYQRHTVRKLNPSEYTFQPQLGYISLNTQLNPNDILAVAYRYTYNGRVYQVGEFAEDLPPDSTNQKIMYMKLLRSTAPNPQLPIWDLMMKNVYALGGLGVSKEDFRLDILYQDPGGGEKRYIPEGPNAGVPLIRLLNLDRLNIQNDPAPDGIFDFVEGVTINTQQGKIIFPLLEPFGEDLKPALGNTPTLYRKYLYDILYDSTKTVARQFQQNNRYVLKGSYKSASSSEIFLGGFNIPQGSVVVTAGGQRLTENVDYQIDYGLGRLKILNTGILNSGIPINVQYEDNATFGFQQQNFMGARLEYFVNEKLALGGTFMRLTERPFTQKITFGDDPIKNTVIGLDANYQSEFPSLTRVLDKLPLYSTTSPSFISATGEVAGLFPGHPKQINALDPEGAVFIDDFEGTRSSYDLKFPPNSWSLAATPVDARDKNNNVLFPEATKNSDLSYGYNRAKLAWYFIEPTLVDGTGGGIPDYVKDDPNQHYIRLVQQQEVFPQRNTTSFQNALSTLDIAFYPKQRGPYNFDADNIGSNGELLNPEKRWGGITRPIEYSDFEQSNVEFIEFWIMDPFINNPNAQGGSLYINLGNISEDVLKDSRKFFENGIPYPKDIDQLDPTVWGYVPRFQQQITRSFDNDPSARAVQDVGYDGLDNEEEKAKFANYLNKLVSKVTPQAYQSLSSDPANDDYRYFRGTEFDNEKTSILGRYKAFNNPHGNSPVTNPDAAVAQSATTIPESEDINRDNTLNESEDYYQYRVDLQPNMPVGSNFIVNKQTTSVKLPNGNFENETWYQFKIPIREYQHKVGNISDFRSVRFVRLFLNGFQDSVIVRFARLELGRNQWRRYLFSLKNPGENIPDIDQQNTEFSVTSVSLEENSDREPIPYVIPPGVDRQNAQVSSGQSIQLNEQALALQVCGLQDGDARAVFKEATVDMRQFERLRMFIHAESRVGQAQLKDGDVRAFIRLGSDFTNNYYEYQVPLKVSAPGGSDANQVWPEANRLDLLLNTLVNAKTERNTQGLPAFVPYETTDELGNTIVVVGNPNIGDAKTIMLGIKNPEKSPQNPNDDGLEKCAEVWFNELRMTGLNETPGYAASGKVNLQLADLGNINLGGSMHTEGYGNIDQKLNQRFRDNFYQYNASTTINLGKLMPRNWGVQLPVFVGYAENVSNPQYDPYDLDVKLKDKLAAARDARARDSIKKVAQDYTSITSVNFSNVRILGNPDKQNAKTMPWSIKNFDLSYAYNRNFKRNPIIEGDELIDQKFGLGYTYTIPSRSIEPFKKLIKSKSRWLDLIKDFNFKPLPTNFTFRSDMHRIFNETQVRTVGDGGYEIEPTYFKNFLWTRQYSTRWELTKSLSFDYNATNTSRIDEPYGKIDNGEKRDTLWNRISSFGRNTLYNQTFSASYNLPLSKFPATDWTSIRATYSANYSWTAASRLAQSLGNSIANTNTIQVNGELNFTQLYNKNRWLRAVNQPKPAGGAKKDKNDFDKIKQLDKQRNVKDLRPSRDEEEGAEEATDSREEERNVIDLRSNRKKEEQPAQPPKAPDQQEDTTGKTADSLNTIAAQVGNLTDAQLDSLHEVQKEQEKARKKAEKEKRKRERKLARQKRRNTTPQVSDIERVGGRLLTMVKRTTINYTENSGTVLPGYMDSTRFFGINNRSGQPGLGFVFGYQPDRYWFETLAANNILSRDSLFNGQLQQRYQQDITMQTTLEPLRDFRIDVTLNRSFSKTHDELFKDISGTGFEHLNPYEGGSFNISYVALKTMFRGGGAKSGVYGEFLKNREIISQRLGNINPYSNGIPDPNDRSYTKGYTGYSQDVLIPAFVAAYGGRDPNSVALINYENKNVRSNPFKYFYPLPNWRATYNGLTKIPAIAKVMSNLVINHTYTGSMSMNSFVSSLFYEDIYGLGFPSFIDSNSGNYVPFFQVPNITISEQLNPLIGFDAAFRNNLTATFQYRKTRTVSLSLIDYQVSETKSSEFVVGAGYRIRGLTLPFEVFGVRKLNNDLNIKVDVGIRDDRTSNNYLAQNIEQVTRGQKVITIAPSIDYIVSDKLTLRLFYDRRQSIPYVSTSYPITTTRAGITLRFIFAQ